MKKLMVIIVSVLSMTVSAQVIENSLGVDPRIDYKELTELGPWDDRNYELTLEDLSWLSDNEKELKESVPVFYRVQYRKKFPDMTSTGKVQYPRSLLNYFVLRYSGYLINGKIYRSGEWVDNRKRFEVDLSNGSDPGTLLRQQIDQNTRSLTGDVLVFSGAESAVSVSPVNPDIVVAGLNMFGQEMLYSSDGGDTWTSAPDLTGSECCDPTMDWKSDGSFVYNVTLGGDDVWFYRSDDNGQTWDSLEDETPGDNRRELGVGLSGNDKEYVHVDRHPLSPFQNNIYVTWHAGNVMQVAVSGDDGNTFSRNSFASDPRGIGSDLVTGSDGVLYHFWAAFNNPDIQMNKSTDGGVSFSAATTVAATNGSFIFPIPSMDTREVFIYVAADMDLSGGPFDGRLYASWTDSTGPTTGNPVNNHARIQVAYSDDGGDSWNTSTPHETHDENEVDRWHQWLKVDRNGYVHVIFYDTRQFQDRSGVDVYHSYSANGGANWSTPSRLTAVSSPGSSSGFEFGDYNGMDFGDSDEGIAIFSDNRDENGGGAADMDVYVTPVVTNDLIFADGFETLL